MATRKRSATKRNGTADPRFGKPLFSLLEAATYLGVPYSTLRVWARPEPGEAPLITVFPTKGHHVTMPFVGFAEAFAIAAAKRAGVPAHRIRPNVEAIKKEWRIDHILAHKLLFTDGAELLIQTGDDMEVPRMRQRQMRETVENQLELISYASDDYAERIQLPVYSDAVVLVDPKVAFGYPFIKKGGVRIKDVLDRFRANERIREIALDFGITEAEVEDVIRAQTQAAA